MTEPAVPFDFARFHAALDTRLVGRSLVYRLSLGSTMDLARREAEEGAVHGTAVLAEEQTAGRGRRGRSFFSPSGANIYVTFVLRPSLELHRTLPLRIPVAVCRAIRTVAPAAMIKWPNDVWVNERKVCGMLIDAELDPDGPIAFPGIGINVNADPSVLPELAGIATALATVAGRPIDREELLAGLCNHLERAFEEPIERVVAEYRQLSLVLGRRVIIDTPGGQRYEATAARIDSTGALVVRLDDGTEETVTAADVTLRPAPVPPTA
ncbi:biotin--[acetyl-CoA-carboxylase] ligase [Tepidiforma sp.]|uniref:biotin--[acetyl-CoA-carboxylase] ligase n=1 Tax=Tepidiforma sp. TaxID=2682230 RepID=UPI002ADD3799|nr:biotin--[acetyl-CoA-carboxylase] ligase [Tepidiforma sp.]